ncbi:Endonuclease-reverse transcriptase [Operophtera brumata]|uniref:Endonuclease-reverse transcriptase n=1 Tax=Operophtera brumata TaxID=104452 RepID=A0A0L7LK10_OPEBR|nr:Endonuclease-reverse transcriptase [Operophtera brumata]
MGPYGLGIRNERGSRLLEFVFGQNLTLSNSFFSKKQHRRWTWFSTDGFTKNEIDFCLSSSKQIIQNVETLNRFKFSSDHRPLRTTITFNMKIHRNKMIKDTIRKLDKLTLIANKEKFNLELKNSFSILNMDHPDNTENQYNHIKECIKQASRKIKTLKFRTQKLTNASLNLIEERQKLTRNSVEYRDFDKKVKRNIRKDLRAYNIYLVQSALDKNRSLKSAMRGREPGRAPMTPTIKWTNGSSNGSSNTVQRNSTSNRNAMSTAAGQRSKIPKNKSRA